jgi:hypothetical protein
MIYNNDFLTKRKKEVEKLLHHLQECKYSGTWDTKVDFNEVIKTIAQSNFIIDELTKEIQKLKSETTNKPVEK